jgi:hypothetical protein
MYSRSLLVIIISAEVRLAYNSKNITAIANIGTFVFTVNPIILVILKSVCSSLENSLWLGRLKSVASSNDTADEFCAEQNTNNM